MTHRKAGIERIGGTTRVTYYAFAYDGRRYVQRFVERANGKQVSETLTGVSHRSYKQASEECARLNGCR